MPLTFPQSNVLFEANPSFVIGVFDVYDREETLGQELNKFDPNKSADLAALLDKYFFPCWSESNGFNAQHRKAISDSLLNALKDECFDFANLLQSGGADFSLPDTWHIDDPRAFFAYCYGEISKRWVW